MNQRNLIVRICVWNFVFYAAAFAILLKAPGIGGAPALPAPADAGADVFEITADTSEMLEGEALLAALHSGGHMWFVRHFETARRNITDDFYKPEHAHLPLATFADCAWQRPLSDTGVLLARRAGQVLAGWRVPIGAVHASPYCRTMESAIEMTGRVPEIDRGLIFRSDSYTVGDANRHLAERYLAVPPPPGENRIVVGHRPPMDALGGIEEGETMIFTPGETGLRLIARIPAENWLLAELVVARLGSANARDLRTRSLGGRWVAPPRSAYPPLGREAETVAGETSNR